MPETELRDMLIEIRGDVRRLVESRADHESRLREIEEAVTTVEAKHAEQSDAVKRLLGWGMFLAAAAGAIGDLLARTLR